MSYPIITPSQSPSIVNNIQSQTLVLNEGQMVHGNIKQLFPGQMAEIQIGNQSMIAKLEIPMKAGDSYYFQVNSVKPELQLKIIAGPTSVVDGKNRQLNKLMEAMQLPKTAEMTQLLSFVMKNKMPITREGLLQAGNLLKNVPPEMRAEALASIQKIGELKLPFTESVFRSLFGVESKEGLHTILSSLKGILISDETVTQQAKSAITSALEKMEKPFFEATGNALLGKSLLALLDASVPAESRFATVQLIKSAGILPERSSLANLPQVLTSLLTNDSSASTLNVSTNTIQEAVKILSQMSTSSISAQIEGLKALIAKDAQLSAPDKANLTAIINLAANSKPSSEASTKFILEFSQALIRITAESSITTPFRGDTIANGPKEALLTLLGHSSQQAASEKLTMLVRSAERSDNPAIQKLLQSAEVLVANVVEGKAVKDAIQAVVRSFGLNYEAALLGKGQDIGRLAEALKPQLLALMQDPTVSQVVRESAENVVARMNGPILMSGENGVQHQLVMQVPLEFFGKRIDATLQWNGRMKEDGKIDPDFARILFYLDLHSLEKTIIDMQVQNRVITVTIFNEDPELHNFDDVLSDKLKEGLESTGYKLSGVFFNNFEEKKVEKKLLKQNNNDNQGVDYRV